MLNRELEKLKYETSVHHRQNLRLNIDQNMIDKLEISPTPSKNYQKAYQDLYKDELQKSVLLHDQRKAVEDIKKEYETQVAGKHLKIYRQDEPFKNSTSAINIPNLNYRDVGYVNYDLLKETKALDHTLKNYDGGSQFWKNSDLHQANQRLEQENMRRTLLDQINQKEKEKYQIWTKRREEENAIKNRVQVENIYNEQVKNHEAVERTKHRDVILDQMHDERVRRGKRSIFNYNNVARHNPITNPIEYHIENPYILRQIQNKGQNNSFDNERSQSYSHGYDDRQQTLPY